MNCSSSDGYLGCFYLLASVNNAVMNMGVQIFLQDPTFNSPQFWYILEVELLNHMVILCLMNWGVAIVFSVAAVPFYISAISAQRLPVFWILSSTYFADFFCSSNFKCEKWYLTVVWICISLLISDIEHLFILLLAICVSSLEKCLFKSFVHF